MEWSPQQDAALRAAARWLRDPSGQQVFRIMGYAGTGKTTLAIHFAEDVGKVLYGAFTGKAALVMRKKGCKGARTIHSLIYNLDDERDGIDMRFRLNESSDVQNADLVIIDECSMVGEELGRDLLSFGTKVLVLGDPAQLPPVKDGGFFTEGEPDVMLTEIHRQARDNPIIRISMDVREGRALEFGDHGACRIIPKAEVSSEDVLGADQILVGRNATRHSWNRRMRELHGHAGAPQVGERLICLRNDREKRLLNGGMWFVESKVRQLKRGTLSMEVEPEERDRKPVRVKVWPEFFDGTEAELPWALRKSTQEFTYGYVITVHKSQGSQWDNVLLYDESRVFRDDARRWLYTGIARAAERITIAMS